jgi:hypothetical protein
MAARRLKTNPLLRTSLAKVAEYALASVRFAIMARHAPDDPLELNGFAVLVAGDREGAIVTQTWSSSCAARREAIAHLRALADRMEARQ